MRFRDNRVGQAGSAAEHGPSAVPEYALETLADALIVTGPRDADGIERIVYVNRAFETLTGYDRQEVIGRSPKLLQGPGTERGTLDRAAAAIREGRGFQDSLTNYRKDGTSFCIDWAIAPCLDPQGRITHWTATLRDVTEKSRALAQLRLSEERLRLTIEAALDGMWDWDLQGGALYWSPQLCRLLGLDPAQTAQSRETFLAHLAPGDHDRLRRALNDHLERGTPYELDCDLVRVDGTHVAVSVRGQAAWDRDGRPVRMVGSVRDVSERRALSQRLLEAEAVAEIGHFSVDMQTRSITWSPQAYRIHGHDPETGAPDYDRVIEQYHPEDRPRVLGAIEAAAAAGGPFHIDARLRRPDGQLRHVHVRGTVKHGPGGEPLEVFGMLQDRTEAVERERQLERAQRLQAFGQLAGGVAHDFNNLMAVILGNVELVQDLAGDRLSAEDLGLLDEAVKAVHRGRALTDSLLGFARAAPLRPRALPLDQVRDEVAGVLARTLPATIAFDFAVAPDTWPVHADMGNLQGALYNLAVNARDAMPGGGQLRIHAGNLRVEPETAPPQAQALPPGPYVAITVADSGAGMEPETLRRASEPFFTTKPVGKGSGLGLSRVQGFAEQSGGTVWIDSVPGQGTTITLLLPAHSAGATLLEPPDPAEFTAPVQGLRVLLAEDLPEMRRMLSRVLERAGFEVIATESGDAALDAFESEPEIDLLLTDIVMPGHLQGVELAAELRRRRPGLPVILLSGYAAEAPDSPGDLPGALPLRLMKPVSIAGLREALDRALFRAMPA